MEIKCKVIIDHHGSYRPGKYGLTIHRIGSGQNTAVVRPVSDDKELRTILNDLGFDQKEIEQTMVDLEKRPSDTILNCSLKQAKVEQYGF